MNMRLILIITMIFLISSCSTKYKGLHSNYEKFTQDIQFCLKKACKNKTKNVLHNLSIISSALAYGGGGGGGGGIGSLQQNKISYQALNICLNKKGYFKDKNGLFELPYLTCK